MWDSLDMVSARRKTYIHRRQRKTERGRLSMPRVGFKSTKEKSSFHTRLGPCDHCDVKDSKDPYYAVWYLLEVKHSRHNLNKYILLKFFERKALCQTDIFLDIFLGPLVNKSRFGSWFCFFYQVSV